MKKLALIMIALIAAGSAQAINWDWSTSPVQTAPVGFETAMPGSGAGWFVQVLGVNTPAGTTANKGWLPVPPTPFYALNGFNFNADEGAFVTMVLYNGPTDDGLPSSGETGWKLVSNPTTLTTGLDAPPTSDITFDFTGSTWVPVPEPATVGLFGLGALSAWIIRRNKMKAIKEA